MTIFSSNEAHKTKTIKDIKKNSEPTNKVM